MVENSLIRETSPYLLQHAHNPVQWHAWNDAALERARRENKPIFLSVGYSSCHWCHVMAHESFENEEVARFMNENFVNIKVDREERPDIDDIYQKACQMATGQGGWPLSAFLTPDQSPFYVGTYFPVLDAHGRPGFGSICRQLSQAWKERPQDIERSARKFVDSMRRADDAAAANAAPAATAPTQEPPRPSHPSPGQQSLPRSNLTRALLDEAAMNLLQMGDLTHGGFGSAPKFPNAANVSFLFRYAGLSGLSRFREFALKTLNRMARGGIFDQIGGGFHRYSTDARWLVPHFEKMLYDNALIPVNYAEAYQITKDPFYLGVMRKTLDFVLREMAHPGGGFYSALDADSDGAEGRFYVWKKGEIREVLGGGGDADLFCLYFDVTDGGNWEGDNILCNNVNLSAVAFTSGTTEPEARRIIDSCSGRLLEHRQASRARPGLDDKILVSWNSLMVTALAKGYRVSGDARYLDAAKRCVSFIEDNLLVSGNSNNNNNGALLLHTYKDGTAKIDGYLDDYAYLANALLDVFEIDPEPRYLELALGLGRHMADHFWDPRSGGFFMTSDGHERLIVRPRSSYDLSMPSGNSVSALVMIRLHHLAHEPGLADISARILESQAQAAAENPFGFGHLLNTAVLRMQGPTEITVINQENSDLCGSLCTDYLPNSIMVTVRSRAQLDGLSRYAFFAGKEFGPRTAVFVCRDSVCSLPLHSAEEVAESLGPR